MQHATSRPVSQPAELNPMTNECMKGCPECSMAYGMSSVVTRVNDQFTCTANPAHKFRVGEDGFLKPL